MYTNQTNIENYIGRALTSQEVANLNGLIRFVTSYIKTYTGRDWLDIGTTLSSVTLSTRLFDGIGGKYIYIDDFFDLSEIEFFCNDGSSIGTITDLTKLVLYPLNKTIKDSIYLRNYLFPKQDAGVSVTAKFTSGVLPDSVIYCATVLCGKQINSPKGGFSSENIEGYSYKVLSAEERDADISQVLHSLDEFRNIEI